MEGVATTYAYEYDAAGRLAKVWENDILQSEYGYDDNGNRLMKNGIAATYDDQDRMLTYGANSYEYTVNGDLAAKTNAGGTTVYTHDALGNLTGVNLPSGVLIEYVYDGRNRLIAKKKDGVVDYRLIYAGQLAPVAKVDATGTTLETYVYGLGVNSPDYIVKDGERYRLVKDHLGTPRLVVNSTTGEVVKRLDLDEFGNVANEAGDFDLLFGFAGGIRDTDTGLTKFGARWYDPETGRWLEKEPLGFRGSYNFYNYCDGDPVNHVDRNGRWKSEGHKDITMEAAVALRMAWDDIRKLQKANVDVDKNVWTFFSDATHFMPDDFTFSDEEDFLDAMDIISSRLEQAIACENAGQHDTAMELLGQGLHTLQDYFSHYASGGGWPAHIEGNPDDPIKNAAAYQNAIDFSRTYIDAFLENTK